MKPVNDATNGAVAAEGTAFNAPTSIRPPTSYDESLQLDAPTPLMAEDELDLQDQLSRLNSDFEDGLDVARHSEQVAAEPCTLADYFGSLARQFKRNAVPRLSRICTDPLAIGVGLIAVGVGIGLAIRPPRRASRVARTAG